MNLAGIVFAFLLTQDRPRFKAETIRDLDCVEILVRPRVMLPLTRGDIRIELHIRRHADHAAFVFVADGGQAGASRTIRTLDGDNDQFIYELWLHNVPAAPWEFAVAVADRDGKILGRADARITMPEVER
jgi:hypothetical protein